MSCSVNEIGVGCEKRTALLALLGKKKCTGCTGTQVKILTLDELQ